MFRLVYEVLFGHTIKILKSKDPGFFTLGPRFIGYTLVVPQMVAL